jgi:hypothetical protein
VKWASLHRTKQPPLGDLREARSAAQYRRRERLHLIVGALFFLVWWGGSFFVEWVTWRLGASATASVDAACAWFIGFPLTVILLEQRHLGRHERQHKRAVRAWEASRPPLPEQFRNGGFNDWLKTEEAAEWLARRPAEWWER